MRFIYSCWRCQRLFCYVSTLFCHFSFKKVFLPPAPPLSLTALCPLFLRLVCHVIKFPHERHVVTLLHAYPTLFLPSYFSLSEQLSRHDTYSSFGFPGLTQAFLSCFFVQIPHTRQPVTERHSAYWMANRLARRSFYLKWLWSASLSLKGAHLLFSDCSSSLMHGAAG